MITPDIQTSSNFAYFAIAKSTRGNPDGDVLPCELAPTGVLGLLLGHGEFIALDSTVDRRLLALACVANDAHAKAAA